MGEDGAGIFLFFASPGEGRLGSLGKALGMLEKLGKDTGNWVMPSVRPFPVRELAGIRENKRIFGHDYCLRHKLHIPHPPINFQDPRYVPS